MYTTGSHQGGSNHPDTPPDIPIEARVKESVEEYRARIEAKRAFKASFGAMGGPVPGPPRAPVPASTAEGRIRAAVITAYVSGDGMAQVADRHGVGKGKVREWLVDAGVTIRPRGTRSPNKPNYGSTPTAATAPVPAPSAPPAAPSAPAPLSTPPAAEPEPLAASASTTMPVALADLTAEVFERLKLTTPTVGEGPTDDALIDVAIEVLSEPLAWPPPGPRRARVQGIDGALACAGESVRGLVAAMAALAAATDAVMAARSAAAADHLDSIRGHADQLLAVLGDSTEGNPL